MCNELARSIHLGFYPARDSGAGVAINTFNTFVPGAFPRSEIGLHFMARATELWHLGAVVNVHA